MVELNFPANPIWLSLAFVKRGIKWFQQRPGLKRHLNVFETKLIGFYVIFPPLRI